MDFFEGSIYFLIGGIVGLPLILSAIAIACISQPKPMGRASYAKRVLISWFALAVLAEILVGPATLIYLPIGLAVVAQIAAWSAGRAAHCGWNKWVGLLPIIPLVGLLASLTLMFMPGRVAVTPSAQPAE